MPMVFQQRKIMSSWRSCSTQMCFIVLVLTVFSHVVSSQKIIETLPGFPGKLPFKMETGYIAVGEEEDVQLFYYFFESQRDPVFDPLLFWLTGGAGPGCSGFSSVAFNTGPLGIEYDSYDGGLPSLTLNRFSWNKIASVIYIDAPVGAGFSYATNSEALNTSDTLSAQQTSSFLRKWLNRHPKFIANQVYIGGDTYSGITVPLVVQEILNGIEAGLRPPVNLQGYVLGNPLTDKYMDKNARVKYAHRVFLISDAYYHNATLYCDGDYVNVEPNNTLCLTSLQDIEMCLRPIKITQVLEPLCAFSSNQTNESEWDIMSKEEEFMDYSHGLKLPELRCREFAYALSYVYMNDEAVQDALGVRNGTVQFWYRCLKSFPSYTENVASTVYIHKNFTKTGLRALIYSGDQDLSVPYVGTLEWIKSLEVPVFDEWRPWFIDGQIAGYQTKFANLQYRLTFATVKGAGATAPEYKPKQSLALIDRFFARYPI